MRCGDYELALNLEPDNLERFLQDCDRRPHGSHRNAARDNAALYAGRAYFYYFLEEYETGDSGLYEGHRTGPGQRQILFLKSCGIRQRWPIRTRYPRLHQIYRNWDPNDPDRYHRRGWLYRFLGKHDLAIADFTSAIELDPDNYRYLHRAQTYSEMGEYELAIADFTKIIQLNPKGEMSLYEDRALAHHELGNHSQAIADITKYIEAYSDDDSWEHLPGAYVVRGSIYRGHWRVRNWLWRIFDTSYREI